MKIRPMFIAALAAPALTLAVAEEGTEKERVQYLLILPDEKTPELVKPTEHCPFTKQLVKDTDDNGDSEHNLVQNTLLNMKATGLTHGEEGYGVMYGGMRLRAGMTVRPVIPNQTVKVKVNSVTPEAIDFVWEDEKMLKRGLTAATFTAKLNLADSIRVQVPEGYIPTGRNDGRKGPGLMKLPPEQFVTEVQPPEPPKAEVVQQQPKTRPSQQLPPKVQPKSSPVPVMKLKTPPPSNEPAVAKDATTGTRPRLESEEAKTAGMILDLFFKKPQETKPAAAAATPAPPTTTAKQ